MNIIILSSCDNIKLKNSFKNVRETSSPVISSLFNQRMLLLVKGTYASDSPISFQDYSNGTNSLYLDSQGDGHDPGFDLSGLPQASSLPIFIDIGEVRISSKFQQGAGGLDEIKDANASKKFWDYIAPFRQVYCNVPYSIVGASCINNGLGKMQEFLNGDGAVFPSVDPSADLRKPDYGGQDQTWRLSPDEIQLWGYPTQYYYMGIYIRSFVTGWSMELGAPILTTMFDNHTVPGINIVPRNNYVPGTQESDKQLKTPFMFPLFYATTIGQKDMDVRPGVDPFIMEVRMNLKENLMVHSFTNVNNNIQTFVGISDWRYNHSGEIDMGGNILTRARIIYPEMAASLKITGGTFTGRHYFAVYRKDEIDFMNQLPLAATPSREGVSKIKYIMDGEYRLICRGDVDPIDGYPETVIRDTVFSVSNYPFNQVISVDLQCP